MGDTDRANRGMGAYGGQLHIGRDVCRDVCQLCWLVTGIMAGVIQRRVIAREPVYFFSA